MDCNITIKLWTFCRVDFAWNEHLSCQVCARAKLRLSESESTLCLISPSCWCRIDMLDCWISISTNALTEHRIFPNLIKVGNGLWAFPVEENRFNLIKFIVFHSFGISVALFSLPCVFLTFYIFGFEGENIIMEPTVTAFHHETNKNNKHSEIFPLKVSIWNCWWQLYSHSCWFFKCTVQ